MSNTFGGQVLCWMMRAATLSAMRHARPITKSAKEIHVLADSIDDVFFTGPSTVGDRLVVSAVVTRAFETLMEVQVRVERSDVTQEESTQINLGYMTFIAAQGRKEDIVSKNSTFAKVKAKFSGKSKDNSASYSSDVPMELPITGVPFLYPGLYKGKSDSNALSANKWLPLSNQILEYHNAIGRKELREKRRVLRQISHANVSGISIVFSESLAKEICCENVNALLRLAEDEVNPDSKWNSVRLTTDSKKENENNTAEPVLYVRRKRISSCIPSTLTNDSKISSSVFSVKSDDKSEDSEVVTFRLNCTLPACAETCSNIVLDLETRKRWDAFFDEAEIRKEIDCDNVLIYERFKSKRKVAYLAAALAGTASPAERARKLGEAEKSYEPSKEEVKGGADRPRDFALLRSHRKAIVRGHEAHIIALRSICHESIPETSCIRGEILPSGFFFESFDKNTCGFTYIGQLNKKAASIVESDLHGKTAYFQQIVKNLTLICNAKNNK
eukprot:g5291.t1